MLKEVVNATYGRNMIAELLKQPFKLRISGTPKNWPDLVMCLVRWNLRIDKITVPRLVLYVTDSEHRHGQAIFSLDKAVELKAGEDYDFGAVAFKLTDLGTCAQLKIRNFDVLLKLAKAVKDSLFDQMPKFYSQLESVKQAVDSSKLAQTLMSQSEVQKLLSNVFVYVYHEQEQIEFQDYTLPDLVEATFRLGQEGSYHKLRMMLSIMKDNLKLTLRDLNIEHNSDEGFVEIATKTESYVSGEAVLEFKYTVYASRYRQAEIASMRVTPSYKSTEFVLIGKSARAHNGEAVVKCDCLFPIDEQIVAVGSLEAQDTRLALFDASAFWQFANSVCKTQFSDAILVSDKYLCKVDPLDAVTLAVQLDNNTKPLFNGVKAVT